MTWVAVSFWFYAGVGLVVLALPYAPPFGVVWLEADGEGGRYLDGASAALKGLGIWAYMAMAVAFGVPWNAIVVVLLVTGLWHFIVAKRARQRDSWISAFDGAIQAERRFHIRVRTLLSLAIGLAISFVALMVRLTFD
jgi:hypothetical protein